MSVEKDRSVD